MAAFVKIDGFVEHLASGVHNLSTGGDTLKLAFSNTAADLTAVNANTAAAVLGTLNQATNTPANMDTVTLTSVTGSQTGGTFTLDAADLTITATGAAGPFQYVFLYNDTPTAPADPLIGYWDYGSTVDMSTGETLTVTVSTVLATVE